MAGKSKNAKLRARLRALEAQAGSAPTALPKAKKKSKRGGKKAAPAGIRHSTSSGNDILAAVSTGPAKAGDVLWTRALAPAYLKETRLGAEAALWARWRPRRLVVELESTSCAPAFGLLAFGWTADESASLVQSSVSNIQRVGAFGVTTSGPLGMKLLLNLPVDSGRKWYDANSTALGEGAHGVLALIASSEIGGFTGKMGINILLRWQVEFEGATLPAVPAGGGGGTTIHPDAEWAGLSLFTTTDTSFSASLLTIKAHPGGSAVTYSAVEYGKVYKIDKTGDLKYVNTSGAYVDISYASRARSYGSPILVFHGSFKDGQDYQKDGTESKCLTYFAAGPWGAANVSFTEASSVADVETLMQRIESLERQLSRLAIEAPGPSRRFSEASSFEEVSGE